MLVDILLQNFGESLGECSSTKIANIDVSINWVIFKVLIFLVKRNAHFNFIVDVFLRSVLDAYVS